MSQRSSDLDWRFRACAGIRDHHGFVIDQTLADGIQVGVDNKDSVAKTLGRPTFTGQFDPNDWYYVSRDTAQLAFRDPKVTEQTVLRVQFDQAGNVASVNKTGKELIATGRPVGRQDPDARPQAQLLRRAVRQYRHDLAARPAGLAAASRIAARAPLVAPQAVIA